MRPGSSDQAMERLWEGLAVKEEAYKLGLPEQFVQAMAIFDSIWQLYPDARSTVARALLHKADCLIGLHDYERASDTLRRVASEFESDDPEAGAIGYLMLGRMASVVDNNQEDARTLFQRAIEYARDPVQQAEAQIWMAYSWFLEGEFPQAQEAFSVLLESSPIDDIRLHALDMVGASYVLQGKLKEAESIIATFRERFAEVLPQDQVPDLNTSVLLGMIK